MSEPERVRRWHTSFVASRPKSLCHTSQRFIKPKVDPTNLCNNATIHTNCQGHWGPAHAAMIVQKRLENAMAFAPSSGLVTPENIAQCSMAQILSDLRDAKKMDEFASVRNNNVIGWERRRWLASVIEDRAMKAESIVRKRTAGHRNLLLVMLEEIEEGIDKGDEECVNLTIECLAKLYYSICCDDAPILETTRRAESAAPLFRALRNRYWTRVDPENPHFVCNDGTFRPPEMYNVWDAPPPPSNLSPTSSKKRPTNSGHYLLDRTHTQQLVDSMSPMECASFTRTYKDVGRIASPHQKLSRSGSSAQANDTRNTSDTVSDLTRSGSTRRRIANRVATPVQSTAHREEILFKSFRKSHDPGDLSPSFSPFLTSHGQGSMARRPDESFVLDEPLRGQKTGIRSGSDHKQGQGYDAMRNSDVLWDSDNLRTPQPDYPSSDDDSGDHSVRKVFPNLRLDTRPDVLNGTNGMPFLGDEAIHQQKVNALRAKFGFPSRPMSSYDVSKKTKDPIPGTSTYKYDKLSPRSFLNYSEGPKFSTRPSTAFARLVSHNMSNTTSSLDDTIRLQNELVIEGKSLQNDSQKSLPTPVTMNSQKLNNSNGSVTQSQSNVPKPVQVTKQIGRTSDSGQISSPVSTNAGPMSCSPLLPASNAFTSPSIRAPSVPSQHVTASPRPRTQAEKVRPHSALDSSVHNSSTLLQLHSPNKFPTNVTEVYQDESTWIRVSSASRPLVRPHSSTAMLQGTSSVHRSTVRGTKDLIGKNIRPRDPIPLASVNTPSTSSSLTRMHLHKVAERERSAYHEGRTSGRITRENTKFGGDGVVSTRPWTAALLSS